MSKTRDKNGLALVAVLWLVLVLMAVVATAGRTSRLDTKVRVSRVDEKRCLWAGRAGVEKAIALLNEDERETDCLTDLWSDNAADLNDIAFEGCTLTIKVVDEASKLNLNSVTKEQLLCLPYMTEEIADAIIDWRDTDDQIGVAGAEAGYYENISFPYMIRNGSFRTVRELLMVKGVTRELLYGEDSNFNGQLDQNENDLDQSPPNDNGDGWLDEGWIAYLTCYSTGGSGNSQTNTGGNQTGTTNNQGNTGNNQNNQGGQGNTNQGNTQGNQGNQNTQGNQNNQGNQGNQGNTQQNNSGQGGNTNTNQNAGGNNTSGTAGAGTSLVNVNTAPVVVLMALMGGGDNAETAAESIIAYRETLLYGIEQVSDLQSVQGMTTDLFNQISESITVQSNVYMIRCWATATSSPNNGITVVTEAVVDRSNSPYDLLYWYQGACN